MGLQLGNHFDQLKGPLPIRLLVDAKKASNHCLWIIEVEEKQGPEYMDWSRTRSQVMGLDLGPHKGTETWRHSKERSKAPELSGKAASVGTVSDLSPERHELGWFHRHPHGSDRSSWRWWENASSWKMPRRGAHVIMLLQPKNAQNRRSLGVEDGRAFC